MARGGSILMVGGLLCFCLPAQQAQHWADRAITRPPLPAVEDAAWCRQPLDRFVRARQSEHGLQPAAAATRATWLRRASLDLTGLPPSPEAVAAFVADPRADAFARAADALLAGEAYGERWAQWWLDLARYADSQGYEKDALRRHAWRWRDWVIAAFAADMPFDRFTIEQLAGDLLPDATIEQHVATAFHRQTMTNTEGGTDDEEFRTAAVIDRVNTTLSVWMGSTAGCAQCHDHKYDPISQREYFGLYAFFDQTADSDRDDEAPTMLAPVPGSEARLAAIDAQLRPLREGDVSEVDKRAIEALEQERAGLAPAVAVMQELPADRRRTTRVFLRGSHRTPGDAVVADVPACWPPLPQGERNRLLFARWLMGPANPRVARVLATRLWEQLFDRGLVATTEDFGLQGELPSHPELLDWLASELIDGGWSVKGFLRGIVLSATYRQDSVATAAERERDHGNRWLARGPAVRLPAEMLRDQALFVSGLLSARVGGPSVMPLQPDGVWGQIYSGETWQTSTGEDRHRRSLYTVWRRTSPHPAMTTFDAPSREFCVVRRVRTNTPLQALVLWNDPQFTACAAALAQRVLRECAGGDDATRVQRMFALCLLRAPQPAELQRLLAYVQAERERAVGDIEAAAWTAGAGLLLNLDEFVTKS